jgi:sec-independent protein translocase protein TatA
MGISLTNLVIILLIILILFGAGKLPKVMGDLGKGLKNFKDGLNAKDENSKQLEDKKNDPSQS